MAYELLATLRAASVPLAPSFAVLTPRVGNGGSAAPRHRGRPSPEVDNNHLVDCFAVDHHSDSKAWRPNAAKCSNGLTARFGCSPSGFAYECSLLLDAGITSIVFVGDSYMRHVAQAFLMWVCAQTAPVAHRLPHVDRDHGARRHAHG